jgi:hypothetical protein
MARRRELCDTDCCLPLEPGWRNWQTQRTQNRHIMNRFPYKQLQLDYLR